VLFDRTDCGSAAIGGKPTLDISFSLRLDQISRATSLMRRHDKKLSVIAGSNYAPCGMTRSLISPKSTHKITAGLIKYLSQSYRILKCHARTLGQRLERWMCCVTEQRYAPLAPMTNGIAVGDCPPSRNIHHREQRLHRRMAIAIGTLNLSTIASDVAAF
jgi:hypothetical protein